MEKLPTFARIRMNFLNSSIDLGTGTLVDLPIEATLSPELLNPPTHSEPWTPET
jgi:hypothetical protein